MHKREFVMIIIALFGCFGLALFIGLAGKVYHIFTRFRNACAGKSLNYISTENFVTAVDRNSKIVLIAEDILLLKMKACPNAALTLSKLSV